MRRYLLYTTLFFTLAGIYSCTENASGVKSVPIDSTNAYGTAPVEYGKRDSTGMLPDADQGEGYRVNTPGGDSMPNGEK
ncbi:hypothetical protein F0919_04620 [Taibaiella lutea]|uniref:Lipoprotein n=1 Tax=Taibaiella lutea TaxID=2608001 RepID=A0A5M6CRF9_9BACT|nr:hypothetical protein [Taibaiella lutea]KAA5536960.1 hypothetical protein F0919_04620 [Taibaiella lutea]